MAYISKDDCISGKKINQINDIEYYINDDEGSLQLPKESIDCKKNYDDYEAHPVEK